MSRWLKSLVVLALVLGGAYAGYRKFQGGQGVGGDPGMGGAAPVGVAAALEKDIQLWNEFSGRLTAVERAEVRPRVSGIIEQVHFTDGGMVNKGDLLFTIDKRSFEADADRAEAMLASARAQANVTRKEATRAARLYADKTVSQRDHDQRQSDADVAAANVKSAEAAVKTARLNLDYAEVRAPISGRAGRAEVTAGNLVEAGMGAAPVLTTIVSSDPIHADFEIDEVTFLRYIGAVSGDVTKIPVRLGLSTEPGTPHQGHVQSFDNRVDISSGTIRVRALVPNPDGTLVPGMFARVLMGSPAPEKSVLITDRAVGTDQDKKFVLVVGADNKVEYRPVRLGPLSDGLRVVETGLKAGERIVVSGLQRARPGTPVVPEVVEMDEKDKPPAQQAPQ